MFRIFAGISILISIFASSFVIQEKQDQEKKKKDDKQERLVLPADDDNAVARRDYMRTKMMFTQNVYAGLISGDLKKIDAAVKEIVLITKGEKWITFDNPKYKKLTEEFETTTKRLAEAVKSKNLDAIALRYYQMSTNCFDCHKHIREAKYEF